MRNTSIEISLLDRNGEVQSMTGLNWGYSNGHVCIDDACIVVRAPLIRANPSFFNPKGDDNRILITWDDNAQMVCLLEGNQEINGILYAKQISTFDDKDSIGRYIRNRINVYDRRINKNDLLRYGRTSIQVTKVGHHEYYFDFSI